MNFVRHLSTRHKKALLHVAGVMVLLSLPFIPYFQGKSPDLFHPLALAELISYALLLLVFYLNYYLLVPLLFFHKRYLLYALTLAALYTSFRYARGLAFPTGERFQPPAGAPVRSAEPPERPPLPDRPPGGANIKGDYDIFMDVDKHIFPFLVMIAFSFALNLNGRWRATEAARARAELAYLKAQINPHFLFNTLNSIYSLAIIHHEKTAEAVVKLSNMMRYILDESETEYTNLQKEINCITDYIDLQKMRFGDAFTLTYEITGDFSGKKIEPLILLSFIENAFKYGINAEEESDIRIRIEMAEDLLHLEVYNRKVKVSNLPENKGGTGLKNTLERLNIVYPDTHSLSIRDAREYYQVRLTIML